MTEVGGGFPGAMTGVTIGGIVAAQRAEVVWAMWGEDGDGGGDGGLEFAAVGPTAEFLETGDLWSQRVVGVMDVAHGTASGWDRGFTAAAGGVGLVVADEDDGQLLRVHGFCGASCGLQRRSFATTLLPSLGKATDGCGVARRQAEGGWFYDLLPG